MMLRFIILSFLFFPALLLAQKPSIDPANVAILYNSTIPESKQLAEYYAKARNIPAENLIGLATSKANTISRKEYQQTIETPLREHFTKQQWWTIPEKENKEGIRIVSTNKINVLVTMLGIPYGIDQDNNYTIPKGSQKLPRHLTSRNSAAVDSELAALPLIGLPIHLPCQNFYFGQDKLFAQANLPKQILVGRIDADNITTCKRMIDDAIAIEKTGLWGMCYLDHALKGSGYQMGDDWLTNIKKKNWQLGIPTTVDRNKDTYLENYPMKDVALYFGWYTTNKNGPFLNKNFKLKRGSITVHLHSFSAATLRDPNKHWTGPLIAAGAAATVGNVYEPYLQGTHHLDILHDRLTKGYTLVESAYMSLPMLSWQNLVIGDPLYQPYKHFKRKAQESNPEDKVYQDTAAAFNAWKEKPDTLIAKLRSAGLKTKDARYYEIAGLYKLHQGNQELASLFFNSAKKMYPFASDKIRCQLHNIDILRQQKKYQLAIINTRELLEKSKDTPQHKTINSLLNILFPPPPPQAKPRKK